METARIPMAANRNTGGPAAANRTVGISLTANRNAGGPAQGTP